LDADVNLIKIPKSITRKISNHAMRIFQKLNTYTRVSVPSQLHQHTACLICLF
jgi:hypothetical protein